MAIALFDHAVFIQLKSYIEEISSLEEAFDILDDWPDDRRGMAYETALKACRDAATDRLPLDVACETFRRFAKMERVLVEIEDVPAFMRQPFHRKMGKS